MIIYYGNTSGNRYEVGAIPDIALLDAYVDFKKGPNRPEWCNNYFMDSGAFSAWKSGRPVVLQEYMDYLTLHKDRIDVYAALDVIGDPDASWDNWVIMKDAGFDPLPAFHIGEDFSWLVKYVEAGATWIGLGGIAGAKKADRQAFLNKVFTTYPDVSKVGFHGFGVMDEDLMVDYPWKSLDARSPHILARFGAVQTPWGKYTINPDCSKAQQTWKTPETLNRIKTWFSEQGYDWELACQSTPEGKFERTKVNILYLEEVAKKCPTIYKPHQKFLF